MTNDRAMPADSPGLARDDGRTRTALVLQGGGALGAYQAGAYQALHEAGFEPDWIAGVSIGAINGALIAGNVREQRIERLRAFWERVTARRTYLPDIDSDAARHLRNAWSAAATMVLGQPGFFTPNLPNPWLSPRGAATATSFYDTAPLRQTLTELVDFDVLNSALIRYAAGAVNVTSGNFRYFDTAETAITLDHILASAALPPALPMVRIGAEYFWDGGLVSNTPLQHVLDHAEAGGLLLFQVDLFSANGTLPRDMLDVLGRDKDIRYSSRTRLVTNVFRDRFRQLNTLRAVLAKVPEDRLSEEERAMKHALERLPGVAILHLIYEQAAYEGQAKDYEFSAASMREHWEAGLRDTRETLRRKDWLRVPERGGLVVHDVHREAG